MSPSMKSKLKSKAGKDQRKVTPMTCSTTNHGSETPASAYNPVSGTFHTLDTTLFATSTPTHDNNCIRNTDDTDEYPSSLQGTVSECDSVSNHGSCSGESEDPKEKVGNSSIRQDSSVPGSDNDRREKIRLKNERKHQRQRERRAQELHDWCCGYLMSRKLESLAQLLVAMGFSSERSTSALILNDGKLEESVSWLFEASETQTKSGANLGIAGNLKIDVSEELAQISDMEARFNCSKQEVERVVVVCEGDLQKAESTLKSQKQESLVIQSKPEEDSAQINGLMRSQGLPSASVSMQQRDIEGEFNYSNVGGSASVFPDQQSMSLQSLHLNHQMPLADKRWVVARSSPSAMFTMAPSTQVLSPSVKMEVQLSSFGNKGRMFQQGIEREAVVMMHQHPQFTKQDPISSVNALPSRTAGLYENCFPPSENIKSNGKFLQNHNKGSVANGNLEQFYQAHYTEHPYVFGHADFSSSGVGGFCKPTRSSSLSPSIHRGSWRTSAPSYSTSLTVPPSLGLFSGQSAARAFSPHSHVDWNTGDLMPEFDYTSVDWTLDCASSSSESSGLWLGISSLLRNSSSSNRMSSSCMARLQNVGMSRDTSSSSSGLREWTSPFAGSDIFSLPRQFVTSPPL